MHGLSKSRLIAHRLCPKRLWLQTYRPELAQEDDGAKARMTVGHAVGEIARDLFPDGVLIDTPDLGQAIKETRDWLKHPPQALYEATFEANGILVRADLLLPDSDGYRMVEVKSATSVKAYYLEDAAIQHWVAKQAGLPLTAVEIAHIDTSFVYPGGGNFQGLLKHVDVTGNIQGLVDEVPAWAAAARTTLTSEEPSIAPGKQCSDPYTCPFHGYCNPPVEGYPPELLPNNRGLAERLRAQGYTDLREIPLGELSNPTHRRICRITQAGHPELKPGAEETIKDLPYPRYYLDFETINPAVPIWAGTRPYMHVPFQWSCHIEHAGGRIEHHEYLAEGDQDPRRRFAEKLLEVLGLDDGPIFVYNVGFERGRMKELAEDFPDFAQALSAAMDRLVDLYPIAKSNYYHPDMRGSWSIKAVLPTIAQDLDYSELDVSDGQMAQTAYLELIQMRYEQEHGQVIRQALLTYCQRDTWAMVRLAHFLVGQDGP